MMRRRLGIPGPVSSVRRSVGSIILLAITVLVAYGGLGNGLKHIKSPDGKFVAVVIPAGKEKGFERYESRISILRIGSNQPVVHDFSSADGEHGYGVDVAQWTPDSQFFVCRMESSGGHSPMYAPIVFWTRRSNRFCELNAYTASQTLVVVAPDKVKVDTWPGLKSATVSLGALKAGEATELR